MVAVALMARYYIDCPDTYGTVYSEGCCDVFPTGQAPAPAPVALAPGPAAAAANQTVTGTRKSYAPVIGSAGKEQCPQ